MKQHLLQGWKLSTRHFSIVILLFLYQLLWGFFLYRCVNSIVMPLLKRYPDTMPSDSAVKLFLMEAQFRLVKTDLIEPYLWMLGAVPLEDVDDPVHSCRSALLDPSYKG